MARYGQSFKNRAVARLLPPESAALAEGLPETIQEIHALRIRQEIQAVSGWPWSIALILVRSRVVRVRPNRTRTPGKNGGLPLPDMKALRQTIDHDDQKESQQDYVVSP